MHPHLSACHSLCGEFNYKRTPLSLPGVKVIAYNSVETIESWATHVKLGYYVGASMHHYRCYKVYMCSAKRVIITETPQHTEDNLYEVTCESKEDNLQGTVEDLHKILLNETLLQSHANNTRAQVIAKL